MNMHNIAPYKNKCKFFGKFELEQKINYWKVIDPTPVKLLYTPNRPYGPAGILCECHCGTRRYIEAKRLVSNSASSCGCMVHINQSKNKSPNWKGLELVPSRYINGIAKNAEKRGFEFSLTLEYLENLFHIQRGLCALTGEPLYFSVASKKKDEMTASVDRIDSTKGYIEGNVQWVSKKVNFMKLNFTQDEFISICRKIVERANNGDI
jgi:hypothetical protein